MSERNPYLLIESRLTDDEKIEILQRMAPPGSTLHGAYVADILDLLHDGDGMLRYTEPFFDEHLDRFDGYDIRIVGAAAVAAAILCMDPPRASMLPLVLRLVAE